MTNTTDTIQGRSLSAARRALLGAALLAGPAGAARLGLVPLMGDGAPGRNTLLSGTGFEPSTTYALRIGGFTPAPATVTSDANGAIAPLTVVLPALPRGGATVLVASAALSRSFTGAYRVWPNLCLSPESGNGQAGVTYATNAAIPTGGWYGMLPVVEGWGFAANAVIAANSITIGGAATTHPAILVSANGRLPSTTLLIGSNLPNGFKDLVINDGTAEAFTGAYEVRRSIALRPSQVLAVAGTTIFVEGWGFAAGTTGAVTVGASATTPASLVAAADGSFSGTLTLNANPGSGAVTFAAPQADTFANAFGDSGANRSIGAYPVVMTGLMNQAFRLEGLGGWGAGTIAANSILVRTPGADLPTTHAAITVGANGRFPQTWCVTNGPMELTSDRYVMTDPVAGAVTMRGITMKRTLALCPVQASGEPGFTISVTGFGFNDTYAMPSNTVYVGGVATAHAATTISARGVLGPFPVVLPARPQGAQALFVNDGTANTFAQAITVNRTIGLSAVVGGGRAGETTRLAGWGFTAGSVVPANTVTFGGLPVTHGAITVSASGSVTGTELALPVLAPGGLDVAAQATSFVEAYRVHDPVMAVTKIRIVPGGAAPPGGVVTFAFSFTNTAVMAEPPATNFTLIDTFPTTLVYRAGSTTNTVGMTANWFHWSTSTYTATDLPAVDIGAVRWSLASPLPAGASGYAAFQVVVP